MRTEKLDAIKENQQHRLEAGWAVSCHQNKRVAYQDIKDLIAAVEELKRWDIENRKQLRREKEEDVLSLTQWLHKTLCELNHADGCCFEHHTGSYELCTCHKKWKDMAEELLWRFETEDISKAAVTYHRYMQNKVGI